MKDEQVSERTKRSYSSVEPKNLGDTVASDFDLSLLCYFSFFVQDSHRSSSCSLNLDGRHLCVFQFARGRFGTVLGMVCTRAGLKHIDLESPSSLELHLQVDSAKTRKADTVGEDGWFGSTVKRSGTADFADMRRGIVHDSDISDKLVA